MMPSAYTWVRRAEKSGPVRMKGKAGSASHVIFPKSIPLKPPRSADERPYPERAAVVHESAERCVGRRLDAQRRAVFIGCPVSGVSFSHCDRARQDPAAHQNF